MWRWFMHSGERVTWYGNKFSSMFDELWKCYLEYLTSELR